MKHMLYTQYDCVTVLIWGNFVLSRETLQISDVVYLYTDLRGLTSTHVVSV